MKKTFVLLILSSLIITLSSCDKPDKKRTATQVENSQTSQDPAPRTITKKEVARIALVEAQQHITNAELNKNLDLSKAQETYKKAQTFFQAGEYKKAQRKAVEVRQIVQGLLIK